MIPLPSRRQPRLAVRGGAVSSGEREVAEEVPVAIVYNGQSLAVLMATPTDLEDLGIGFTLTEGLADDVTDIDGPEVIEQPQGIEVRMWISSDRLRDRQRSIVGPIGCGLCGIESLEQAVPAPAVIRSRATFAIQDIAGAVAALDGSQPLGRATRAVHAAGLWTASRGLVAVREDVGRHNALDKLAGAVARAGIEATEAIVALTSRVSVEMVQKTAQLGAPVIAAVSAPTALAIRVAEEAGLTLAAVVRPDGFELFTGRRRIIDAQACTH